MPEALVNHLGGLSLPRKSVIRVTDHPDMTITVYNGCKTTTQQRMSNKMVSSDLKESSVKKSELLIRWPFEDNFEIIFYFLMRTCIVTPIRQTVLMRGQNMFSAQNISDRSWSTLMCYVVVVLLVYVHGKHLRSCRDGQLT